MPEQLEVAGDHEPVAAVVAPAAGDRHGAPAAEGVQEPGGVAPGVFHEHDPWQGVLLDRESVEFTDLGAGEGVHARESVVGGDRTGGTPGDKR